MGYIKLSTMVVENVEIYLPEMGRNALKIEAMGNYDRLLRRQHDSEQKVR